MWLKNQRNSRHGVDYAFNLKDFDLQAYHRRYCETLLAVDESLGRIFRHLEERGAAGLDPDRLPWATTATSSASMA